MAIQYTPALSLPYPEVTDAPLIASRDLRALAQRMDSQGAQIRGESTAALTAGQAAQALAAQALARVNLIEEPIHIGPTEPSDGEELWVDTGDDSTGRAVSSTDITDATTVGRSVLTAPDALTARQRLAIWTGTRQLLDQGTDTAERTWDARELHEYVTDTAEASAGAASWDDLADKPATFPPAPHQHVQGDVTGLPAALTQAGTTAQWASVSGTPTTYPPATHTHTQAQVTGLTAALDAKVDTSDPRLTDARPPTAHTHDDRYYTEAEVDAAIAAALSRSTGLLDVTAEVPLIERIGAQGGLTLSRVGNLVQVSLYSIRFKDIGSPVPSSLDFGWRLPVGFRPITGALIMESVTQGTATIRVRVGTSGQLILYSPSTATSFGNLVFPTTDPWPTVLPGTPA